MKNVYYDEKSTFDDLHERRLRKRSTFYGRAMLRGVLSSLQMRRNEKQLSGERAEVMEALLRTAFRSDAPRDIKIGSDGSLICIFARCHAAQRNRLRRFRELSQHAS